MSDPTAGQLKIICQESIAGAVLPSVIEKLSRKYPHCGLHVITLD
jgi:DNA-binding transcriptional LysR family regulator